MTNSLITPSTIFHERQIGNYCRCHAINNLFGKSICPLQLFIKYCDEYDKLNNMNSLSRTKYIYYNNGNTDNIFGYIIEKAGFKIEMIHYDFYKPVKITILPQTIGMIVYNKSHTYCIRKYTNKFYLIDSMRTQIIELPNPVQYCKKNNLGVIVVNSK